MSVDTVGTGSRRTDVTSKISGPDNRSTSAVGAGKPVERVRDVASQPKTAEQGSTEGVTITGAARQLAQLEERVKDMPAVDEAKVAAISASIEQGTYKVQPEKVADGLMSIEAALAPLTGRDK
jgi:negative regulator of flagellin synthesis FlgM